MCIHDCVVSSELHVNIMNTVTVFSPSSLISSQTSETHNHYVHCVFSHTVLYIECS